MGEGAVARFRGDEPRALGEREQLGIPGPLVGEVVDVDPEPAAAGSAAATENGPLNWAA